MRFIHTSDICLGAVPDEGRDWSQDRTREIEEAFDRIISDCNEKHVDLLLIAGNLFNAPPTFDDLVKVDAKLQTLEHTRTIIISGDRDYMEPTSDWAHFKFRSKSAVLPAEKTTNAFLKNINTCITGYSYGKNEHIENVIGNINPGKPGAINILLGCGGDAEHMPFNRENIARKGFHYIALGHSTNPVHILKNRMAYSGSPEPLGPNDRGNHGYILGEIDEKGTRIKWCPIAKRSYINFQFDLSSDLKNEEVEKMAEDKMLKLGKENIYTIVLKGFTSDDKKPDFSRIQKRFNVYRIVDKTISRKKVEQMEADNEKNLVGRFISEVNDSYTIDTRIREKALRYGLEALIKAGE